MLRTFIALAFGLLATAAQAASSQCLPEGTQPSGAKYLICMPDAGSYNGQLVVFAHGYVAADQPVGIPYDQITFPDGSTLPQLLNSLGFGFAMSSYSVNGWAVKEGIADSLDLVQIYAAQQGQPSRVLMTGASEGGLIAAKSAETYPATYAGALAVCGIVGDFPALMDYQGSWRIVWDYYFPGLIPGTAVDVPQQVIDDWTSVYQPAIAAAIAANPASAQAIASAAKIPTGGDVATAVLGAADRVLAVNSTRAKLGGQPFDNQRRLYTGTDQNLQLNRGVARYAADPVALAEMNAHYQTTGVLPVPVVTMHNLADPTVPFAQETLYLQKIRASGSTARHALLPINRYGHCNFSTTEMMAAFAILLSKVAGQELGGVEPWLRTPAERAAYHALLQQHR